MKARPRLFGEVNVATNVPGIDLLQCDDDDSDDEDIEGGHDTGELMLRNCDSYENGAACNDDLQEDNDIGGAADEIYEGDQLAEDEGISSSDDEDLGVSDDDDEEDEEEEEEEEGEGEDEEDDEDDHEDANGGVGDNRSQEVVSKTSKRKFSDFDAQLCAGQASLRVLKKIAVDRMRHASPCSTEGILSNEDFQKIKEKEVCCLSFTLHES